MLAWLPQAQHPDLTGHLQDRTGAVQTQDRLRSASALPFVFAVLSRHCSFLSQIQSPVTTWPSSISSLLPLCGKARAMMSGEALPRI